MSPRSLIITPGQLAQRAELYHQMAQLTTAGLPILRILEQLEQHPPTRSFRAPLGQARHEIAAGFTFSEAFARTGQWLAPFDLALLEAGERSGRLDACFRVLADYYTDRARTARQTISDLAYPVFLFHFAIFILPFAQFFTTGNVLVYALKTLGVLLPIYFIAALALLALQGRHGFRWRALMERGLHLIPVLGAGRRELALARLSMALESLLAAGVPIADAWELAGRVSGSPYLHGKILAWKPDLRDGSTPAELVSASHAFPDLFANQYHSGEVSGKLDETLKRLHQYFHEEGTRKIRAFAQWVPRLIYLLVALFIAYKIISFYRGFWQTVNDSYNF